MADESNVITQQTVDAEKAAENMKSYAEVMDMAKEKYNSYIASVAASFDTLEKNQQLTDRQAKILALSQVEILGARDAFVNLNNVDTSGLSTFTQQFEGLTNIIKNSPLNNGLITSALEAMSKKTGRALDMDGLKKALSSGKEAVLDFTKSFLTSADNSLRLQNGYLQLSAATGELSQIYEEAGSGLSNLNSLLSVQQRIMSATSQATNTLPAVTEQYYSQLKKVPGAFKEIITSSKDSSKSVSEFTATIQLSQGAGMKYSDVVDDLAFAYRNYNIVGEEALKFTARIGELTQKYGLEMSDVRGALKGLSYDFRMFGNESEGAANIMNKYVGSLKNTGISGAAAIEIFRGMTTRVKDMTIAQQGFLSAQSGGAGGLMGAFQIEKELRDGKIDKVFDRVRQTMSKQFGKIVSLEEASQSNQAAAQLTKQIEIIQNGALGKFAQTRQEAIRLLAAFKEVDDGKKPVSSLNKDILSDTMEKGSQISDKSYTPMAETNFILEEIRSNTSLMAGNIMQEGFTAAPAKLTNNEGDKLSDFKDSLRTSKSAAGINDTESNIDPSSPNKLKSDLYKSFNKIGKVFDDANLLLDAISPLKIKNELQQPSIKSSNTNMQTSSNINIDAPQPFSIDNMSTPNTSKNQLGEITTQAINLTPATQKKETNTVGSIAAPQINEVSGEITVHVEVSGDSVKESRQSYAVNVGQKAKK